MRRAVTRMLVGTTSPAPLHVRTPLLYSDPLSRCLGADVFLKMDCLQPIGSFKIRGIGATVQALLAGGAKRIVSSSGGNAGLATAYAAKQLGVLATVVVPTTTPEAVREKLRAYGAEVVVHGDVWDEANNKAMAIVEEQQGALVHPFDAATTHRGHATLVEELATELPRAPDAIVTVVGGGGLLMGILQGLQLVGWESTARVLACETVGASSMAQSLAAGELVTLSEIASVAKSLGAKRVSSVTFDRCRELGPDRVVPHVVSDAAAVSACVQLATDHRVLVEPACGAGLAAVYERAGALEGCKLVVVEVCGGAGVDLAMLQSWMHDVGIA